MMHIPDGRLVIVSAQRVQVRSSRSRVRITLQELFLIWLGGRITSPRVWFGAGGQGVTLKLAWGPSNSSPWNLHFVFAVFSPFFPYYHLLVFFFTVFFFEQLCFWTLTVVFFLKVIFLLPFFFFFFSLLHIFFSLFYVIITIIVQSFFTVFLQFFLSGICMLSSSYTANYSKVVPNPSP